MKFPFVGKLANVSNYKSLMGILPNNIKNKSHCGCVQKRACGLHLKK